MQSGTHRLGPDNATLQVKTYRQGMASKVGHDLVIDVTSWDASVTVNGDGDVVATELNADPGSFRVREGRGGAKPLSDKDRAEISKNTEGKVLGGKAISFRSTSAELDGGGRLLVSGELGMAGNARPVNMELTVGQDGRVQGTIPLNQSEWGIKPYSALMGALKVRDDIEVVLDAQLPQG